MVETKHDDKSKGERMTIEKSEETQWNARTQRENDETRKGNRRVTAGSVRTHKGKTANMQGHRRVNSGDVGPLEDWMENGGNGRRECNNVKKL